MMVRPTHVGFRYTNNINGQSLKALVIVPVVFKGSRMSQAMDILKKESKRAIRFVGNRISV